MVSAQNPFRWCSDTGAVGVTMAVRTGCRVGTWAVKSLVVAMIMVVEAVKATVIAFRGSGDSVSMGSSSA